MPGILLIESSLPPPDPEFQEFRDKVRDLSYNHCLDYFLQTGYCPELTQMAQFQYHGKGNPHDIRFMNMGIWDGYLKFEKELIERNQI